MNSTAIGSGCVRVLAFASALGLGLGVARAQTVERTSASSTGGDANQDSTGASMSRDGRFVVFSSAATNLVASDTNGTMTDVFVRDRVLQTTTLVSVDNAGLQHAVSSTSGRVSLDGRYVVFLSKGLVAGDTDFDPDVYLRDRLANTTTLLTANGEGFLVLHQLLDISDDGHRVLMYTTRQVPNIEQQLLLLDHTTSRTWHYDGSSPGLPFASNYVGPGVMSSDGLFVAYAYSYVDGYGMNAWNAVIRINTQTSANQKFMYKLGASARAISPDGRFLLWSNTSGVGVLDSQTGTSEILTTDFNGQPTNANVLNALMSNDGRYVAFTSSAANLVASDSNAATDVFLRDRVDGVTLRVSLDAAGAQANGASTLAGFAVDGSLIAFDSAASNLIVGDGNAKKDVFTRTNCFNYYGDADGDGFGAGASQLACVPPPAGLSLNALDCDDANANRHPGAIDGLNGIDDDCDNVIDEEPSGVAYCTSSTTFFGCSPSMSATGIPSVSASSGFVVRVDQIDGQRNGLIYYGTSRIFSVFGGAGSTTSTSYFCVAAPRQRMGIQSSGGTLNTCTGSFATDVLAWTAAHPGALATPLAAGTTLHFQGWFRDPNSQQNANLSNGWSAMLSP